MSCKEDPESSPRVPEKDLDDAGTSRSACILGRN